jgi:hypothetical protein
MEKKLCKVEATKIVRGHSSNTIHFECPFCYQSYNKNGEPRKGSKHIEHHHGLMDMEWNKGYVSDRIPHCMRDRFPYDTYRSFKINITENTKII